MINNKNLYTKKYINLMILNNRFYNIFLKDKNFGICLNISNKYFNKNILQTIKWYTKNKSFFKKLFIKFPYFF